MAGRSGLFHPTWFEIGNLRSGADLRTAPLLTAATGMDAIAHCIETFLSPAFNPPADGIALDGLWRGWGHIERAPPQPRATGKRAST